MFLASVTVSPVKKQGRLYARPGKEENVDRQNLHDGSDRGKITLFNTHPLKTFKINSTFFFFFFAFQ